MASSAVSPDTLNAIHNKATQLRIESVRATTEAGSGHPSSCCSAADIVAALFFSVMRYDPKNPKALNSDRFVLSKGHAAPLLYAAWAEAGLFPKSELLKLRTLTSDLKATRPRACRLSIWLRVRWGKAFQSASALPLMQNSSTNWITEPMS